MERGRLVGMMEGGRMEQLMKRIPKVDTGQVAYKHKQTTDQKNKQTNK